TASWFPPNKRSGRKSRWIGCCRSSNASAPRTPDKSDDLLFFAGRQYDSRVVAFSSDSTRRTVDGSLASAPPVPARRARTSHRQTDDGDSPRKASRGVREQPERRAREASRAAIEERRRSASEYQRCSGRHP